MLSNASVLFHSGMFHLLLWIVGIGFVNLLSAKGISTQDSNTIALKSALHSFLPGKGIPQAARRDTTTIQKIVIIGDHGDVSNINRYKKLVTIEDWRAKTVFDIVLIGVLKNDTVVSDTRSYSNGCTITFYRINNRLEIYEAQTGNLLQQKSFLVNHDWLPDVIDVRDIVHVDGENRIYFNVNNSDITQYIMSLKLGPIPQLPDVSTAGTVTDVDGNVYQTVKIGKQVWMAENLRVTKYNDGSAIPFDTSMATWRNATKPKYCFYNNTTNSDDIKKYGALYNWYAINTGKLAPSGWHVPTVAEWDKLQSYLVANGYNWDGSTRGNKIAKALAAKSDWSTSTGAGAIGNDLTQNNKSVFSALPGGSRYDGGEFYGQRDFGIWWFATVHAEYRHLSYDNDYLPGLSGAKGCGLSVRLLRDN